MSDYELEVVYHKLSDTQKLEIITMWVSNKAVPLAIAQGRVDHVVCVIKYIPTNKIIGVSTAPVKLVKRNNSFYYFYGMFIDPEHRGKTIPHRQPWILATTIERLKQEVNNVKGIVAIIENVRIPDKLLIKQGFQETKLLPVKQKVFYLNFDGSEFL